MCISGNEWKFVSVTGGSRAVLNVHGAMFSQNITRNTNYYESAYQGIRFLQRKQYSGYRSGKTYYSTGIPKVTLSGNSFRDIPAIPYWSLVTNHFWYLNNGSYLIYDSIFRKCTWQNYLPEYRQKRVSSFKAIPSLWYDGRGLFYIFSLLCQVVFILSIWTIRNFRIVQIESSMVNNLSALKRFFNMAHIVEEGFADAGFGIDGVASTDNSERYLSCVP